jgi:hypothetical protein
MRKAMYTVLESSAELGLVAMKKQYASFHSSDIVLYAIEGLK